MELRELFLSNEEIAKFIGIRIRSTQNLNIKQCLNIALNANNELTEVRSYDEWKDVGRQVALGEHGKPYSDPNSLARKKISYVFDYRQTKGHIRKPKEIKKEEFLTAFQELDDIFTRYNYGSVFERKGQIAILLNIKLKEEKNDERVGEVETRITRVHSGTDNGNRRVSQTRKGTPVGSQLTFLGGTDETNQQIRTTGDGISTREQSAEVFSLRTNNASSSDDIGVTGQDRSVQGSTDRYLSEAESDADVSRERSDVYGVSFGNGTNDIRGIHSTVRGGLAEDVALSSSNSNAENYLLTSDDFSHRSPKERCSDNITAIKIVKQLQAESRTATPDEQARLAKYVGWGGLQDAFDENNASWREENVTLKTILADSEYKSAKETVLNAHFTSKEIIDGIYCGLRRLGVKSGKALEPSCGTGNFIGCVPEDVSLKFDGIELDELTADIAKALYPKENIKQSGFEDVKGNDNAYDVVVGNVPFGDYRVYDSDYNRHKFVIHDYFIAKSLDKLRSGGIMAVITGKGTLDKLSKTAREYFAQRAELLGAFRLPNTAFKSNAGTEAVADILFFRKREELLAVSELEEKGVDWLNSETVEKDVAPLNEYFVKHPENVLGEFKIVSGRFGQERTVIPTTTDLKTQIERAVNVLPENAYKTIEKENVQVPQREDAEIKISEYELDKKGIKKFSMFLTDDNRVFIRDIDGAVEIEKKKLQGVLEGKTLERVKEYIRLRDEVVKMIDMQCENCSDDELAVEREKLNAYYDKFVKSFGYLGEKTNQTLFDYDLQFPLVFSIEDYREEEKVGYKGALFFQRTIRIPEKKTHTDDIFEALAICKNELGEVDIQYIEKLTGLSYEQTLEKLDGEVYQTPDVFFDNSADIKYSGWQTKSEYLSGDVMEKIENAQYISARIDASEYSDEQKARIKEQINKNIADLTAVVPKKLKASDISVRLGCTWIENKDYAQFLKEILNTGYNPEIMYNEFNGQYGVYVSSLIKYKAESVNVWGTSRMNAVEIFDCAINNRPPTVWDLIRTDDKEKRVVNKDETALAREKVKEMNAKFKSWLWDNPSRCEKYENIYNRKFNSIVVPSYDGSHLQFEGMNAAIELRQHQKDAVARICSGKNTLLHHCVGAGKTFEIIAGAMKLKQYGLANKPMIVVPKPLISQWARDVKLLYPNAKVLVATEREFEVKNRQKFVAKTATGDWDVVIIGESQFRRIPVSAQRQIRKMEETIETIRQSIEDCNDRYYGQTRNLTVKKLIATLKKKEAKYKELTNKVSKIQDNVIEFEKLGVDALFVDEAHYFKNKEIETSMSNVAGITTGGSERAYDLETKIDYIRELHGGEDKGVVFATGTPISNSMAEMYTMMSYLIKEKLNKLGINYFDAWASNFGEVVSSLELKPSGKGVKQRMRFARFVNLVELQRLYREFADVKTREMLNLPVPEAENITISLPATAQIIAYNDEIIARGERIEAGGVSPEEDNMLVLTSDGKKLALDPRCLDENAVDDEDTKVNACIKKVFEIYEKTQAEKSTQVIFCDQSTPKNDQWSIYQDIKDKLIALGIPENEIAFIHEADTDKKKENLFAEMNSGEKRVLLGSTVKCGVGANFQRRLIALHHLDVPYRPADMEQREGRIIRQGNENKKVELYSYITEKTFDSYSYQILENKQRFISQINKGDMTIREANDIDETTLSFAQIKAIATANPDFLRQMELLQAIKELKMLRSKHFENNEVMKKKIMTSLPEEIAKVGAREEKVRKDIADLSDKPEIIIGGILFSERTVDGSSYRVKAGEALNVAFRNARDGDVIGQFGKFDLIAYKSFSLNIPIYKIVLKGNSEYYIDYGESGLGNVTKIENAYKEIPDIAKTLGEKKSNLFSQIDELKKNIDKPFSREDEIVSVERELAEIEERLNVDKDETVAYSEDSAEEDGQVKSNDKENDIENDIENYCKGNERE